MLLAWAAELMFLDHKAADSFAILLSYSRVVNRAMSFSTVAYETRRAEQIANEQQEKQEKLAILNNKMAKIDGIKEKHEQLVVDRQKRRLSEMQPQTHIGGYSSFTSASTSPKNSMKASVGTFGSAAKSTASTPKTVASDINVRFSCYTHCKNNHGEEQLRYKSLKKYNSCWPKSRHCCKKSERRASVAVKLNASRRASSSRLSTGTPVNTNSIWQKTINCTQL